MGAEYELHADEAWTHGGPKNIGRYWCFFGGVFGLASDVDRLHTRLLKAREQHGIKADKLNWKNANAANAVGYAAFADAFFSELSSSDLRYRQMFLDRSLVRTNEIGQPDEMDLLDVQFRVYYQFLKHAFWLKALPPASVSSPHIIRVRLDEHSSQRHKAKLQEHGSELPRLWERRDIRVDVSFVRARTSQSMQVSDLLCGAAGSHGNRAHLWREPGQRGMKSNQKARSSLAKSIYERFRKFDADQRGSKAFNWFETTGSGGNPESRHNHKMRIWKFRPSPYLIDKGWENDSLINGRYQGPQYSIAREYTAEFPGETY